MRRNLGNSQILNGGAAVHVQFKSTQRLDGGGIIADVNRPDTDAMYVGPLEAGHDVADGGQGDELSAASAVSNFDDAQTGCIADRVVKRRVVHGQRPWPGEGREHAVSVRRGGQQVRGRVATDVSCEPDLVNDLVRARIDNDYLVGPAVGDPEIAAVF